MNNGHKKFFYQLLYWLTPLLFATTCSENRNAKNMKIISPAFADKAKIPKEYSCDDKNLPPPLQFINVPQKAKSLALIMEDPDAPKDQKMGTFVHWVVWGIDPATNELNKDNLGRFFQGMNSKNSIGYTGPCPPQKEHRYFFKLYALDNQPTLPQSTTRDDLLKAIDDHVIAKSELMGTYVRP
jgi:Raf kinase inhibitor-like YbhB/YbcL family protein